MGVEPVSGGVDVTLGESGDSVIAERVLIAVGRAPVTRGVGLENVRAETQGGYVLVNEWCETAEPGLYAIGDLISTPLLAHVASMEGVMVVERIAGREVRPVPYGETPNCTYCEPEVASVGLTQRGAEEGGIEVEGGERHQERIGRYFRVPVPRTRLWPDLRSCFLRALRLSEARRRAVFLCAMMITSQVAPWWLRGRRSCRSERRSGRPCTRRGT